MRVSRKALARRGILLMDLLIYFSLLVIVLAMAATVFDRGMREAVSLQRNVADIERTMKAGERWRADVREATGAIRLEKLEGGEALVIPRGNEEVRYALVGKDVRRGEALALAGVKVARMIEEKRGSVTGWRWEIELETRRKQGKVRPLFTFMAVPGKEAL